MICVVSTAAQIHDKPGHWSFLPPRKSPACQRSFQFPTGYFSRSRFSSQPGWNVALEARNSPTTLHVCSLADLAWPAFIGVSLQQASPTRSLAGQGVNLSLTQSIQKRKKDSFWVANATHGKTSDAYWLKHYSQH